MGLTRSKTIACLSGTARIEASAVKAEMPMSSVRVALFGCGQWGKNVARTLAEAGALAVVTDAFPAQAEALAKALGVPFEHDAAKILADASIQACAVTTPAETHFAVAKQAIRAGKDVFVEKPITTQIEDAIALKELAAD